ncbi:DUF7108 family protein [Natronolimnobius baerhuensis]|uniref:RnhA operon protein n=1 Tax=Natronolimnobius baerhuensis TaxID=253108 RepID=A0A202E4S8_9EURY|nr:hypothetical protein [Natronolimnobius baerhuensis]OVE83255.1 rnhA operon protein [Natronolimnobius baerhuensis]
MSDQSHRTDESGDGHAPASESDDDELPDDIVEDAERLTHLEREAHDPDEATAYADHREDLLEEHDFTSRIRDDDGDDVLVLHPEEWHDAAEGVIRTDRIDDISRAVEIQLEGAEDPDDWDAVETHNRDLAERVRESDGDVHGDNAETFVDFVSNHYAKQIESVTGEELTEFRTEYFVRNAWPSERQRAVIDDSIRLVYETANKSVPEYDRPR